MPAPDSTVEEVRGSVLRYLRMYEEGKFTLRDFAAEIAIMAAAYDHAIGGIEDAYGELLAAAYKYHAQASRDGRTSFDEFEQAVTAFRRAEAAW